MSQDQIARWVAALHKAIKALTLEPSDRAPTK